MRQSHGARWLISAVVPILLLICALTAGAASLSFTPEAQGSASLTLQTSDATPAFGQSITLTLTLQITGSSQPSIGGFSIYDGSTALVANASANTVNGFVYSTSSLAVGKHTLVATYVGSLNGLTATSNSIVVQVGPAGLNISSLNPASVSSGRSAFELTVLGSDFRRTSAVYWNGIAVTTSYVSATELRASISRQDVATPGVASVTVVNPAPNAGRSSAARFTIEGSVPASERFVAPNGSDSNPGTIGKPYRTIQKCASTVASGGTCQIRAGTYRETVAPNSSITITSYDGEPVTVDGSDPVTGWTLYKGSIYKAKVTLSSGDTNQVFVGDQMMTEARWPNGNDLFHVNWATAGTGTTATMLVDSHLPKIDWAGARIHLWSGTDPWDPQTGTVTVSQAGKLSFTVDGASYPPYIQPQPGGYYYLFGILAALDIENEWFYDAKAHELYLWAPGGAHPNTLSVRAKQRQFAFDLSGKSGVTIENINLFASTVMMDTSSADNTLDQLNVQYASHFTSLRDVAGYAHSYWYDHTSDSGVVLDGAGNLLENSTIVYSAGNGVAISGTNNIVRNNLIHHADYMGNYCAGITLTFQAGNDNKIASNTIYALGRFAIDPLAGQQEDIGYNNLFNAMMLSRDGGEIYGGGYSAIGTRIHHNWLHDTQSLISGPADNYALAGVYLDEDQSGMEVDQNALWNNQYYNIFLNGSNDGTTVPNDNSVHNNTVPDVGPDAYIYTDLTSSCGTTQITANRAMVALVQSGTVCPASDNGPNAPGANQMNASVQVGCNFAGCSSEGPPTIVGSKVSASVAVQPLSVSVPGSVRATFAVTAAGSAPIHYQWKRDGVAIAGATGASYTTSPVSAADSGAIFTVEVSNSTGSATSQPAILTVN